MGQYAQVAGVQSKKFRGQCRGHVGCTMALPLHMLRSEKYFGLIESVFMVQ